ncbi:STAS domain-containing protein [Cytophagales bacterium LB-30]|uniref:Anti-sigma factor antagonist n=1 Tax=Shiella aurantiaca TaxID=3058365 RepID=A0ABT8F6R2_9BACT|nr:STAS domain-containing protein [Shiella aurantiaca]MDN4165924.1 STAS domain-containing protein [Shiella aurantiaca]
MKYTHHVNSGVLVLQFEGDLIGEEHGPEIVGLINDQINEKVALCAIDISKVRYINSNGIGVLITVLTKFRNKGGEVVLVNPSEHVKKLLIITKLDKIFTIMPSEAEAIKALTK